MHVCFPQMHACTQEVREGVGFPLELEIQLVVNQVGAEI